MTIEELSKDIKPNITKKINNYNFLDLDSNKNLIRSKLKFYKKKS